MADNQIAVTPGSGANVRTVTNAAVDSGAHQQVFTPADAQGNINPSDPDGTQNSSDDPSTLLLDSFDNGITNFNTGGTAGSASLSAFTFASNQTASSISTLASKGTFLLRAGSYLRNATYARFETGVLTNTTRFWGVGTIQGSPTAAAPVLNGAVFQLDYADGNLYAVTYSNGAQTKLSQLTRPTDGQQHRYDIWYRQSVIYWLIDGLVVYTKTSPQLSAWQSPAHISGQINNSTAPSSAPTLVLLSVSMADTGGNNKTISDGTNPWIQASVKQASTAVAATDSPLAVGLHPSSPLPAGSNSIGTVLLGAGGNTVGTVNLTAPTGSAPSLTTGSAATNAILIKSSVASLFEFTLYNQTTSQVFINFYSTTSTPVPGTTAVWMSLPCAASATTTYTYGGLGKRFVNGLGIAIVTAFGGSTGATLAAGSLLTLSYI